MKYSLFVIASVLLFASNCNSQDLQGEKTNHSGKEYPVLTTQQFLNIEINNRITLQELIDGDSRETVTEKLGDPVNTIVQEDFTDTHTKYEYDGLNIQYTSYPGDHTVYNISITGIENSITLFGRSISPGISLNSFKERFPNLSSYINDDEIIFYILVTDSEGRKMKNNSGTEMYSDVENLHLKFDTNGTLKEIEVNRRVI